MQSLNTTLQPVKTVYDDTQSEQHAKPPSGSGSMGRFAVNLYNGTRSFVTSLSPNYLPDHLKTDNETPLSATTHYPVSGNRPATFTGSLFEGAGLACSLMSYWCPQVQIVADVAAKLCAGVRLADELRRTMAGNPATSELGHTKPKQHSPTGTGTNHLAHAAAAAVAVEALDRLAGTAAVPLPDARGGRNNPIPVGDSATLKKIGRDPKHPSNAFYIQTGNIDAKDNEAIGSKREPFSGSYDGMCRTIRNQKECLFKSLSGNVHNLHLSDAKINVREESAAVVACQMTGAARIENVAITRSQVATTGDTDFGQQRYAYAGVVTAHQNESPATRINGVNVTDCSVATTGNHSFVGIAGGHISGEVTGLKVLRSNVTSEGTSAYAGIGAGILDGQIRHLSAVDSQVVTEGSDAHAGIGAGLLDGQIRYLSAVDSQVVTEGIDADAGIGCGLANSPRAELSFITAIDSKVSTIGDSADAAIGAGQFDSFGQISDVTAYGSNVHASGVDSAAAVGSGYAAKGGQINNIKAINTTVIADGEESPAGIGAGLVFGESHLENITALNCEVRGNERDLTGIAYGELFSGSADENSTKTYNSMVYDQLQGRGIDQSQLNHLCETADSRFLANDCRVVNYAGFANEGCEPRSLPTSSVSPTPTSVAPIPFSTVPLASATASSLSSGAIAGIALGSLVGLGALGVAGYLGFRHYSNRHGNLLSETESVELNDHMDSQDP
ncbi:hypothetical protein [Endozoicomonas sp. SCSIO W0465]|uniref:hypothetical protein n=1 Tax=Endozoicomonas sp. SCSIO W0465 TaxID=2918516 RepID=UPI002075C6E2|nr:hypothetical protein [Endozoicomonas sp. SCSIO W0465]USE35281.1 hypothetical protein MJO57_24755 [Endozoicomonas sp. SCSIO W0465]